MERKYLERLVGKYCKIVTKEPGENRANVVTGILEDVDYKDGFILIDSSQGLGCLRINTIVAIKPGHKRKLEAKKIKDEDQAVMGIGTLIVFIAMILVAAVAASVIIQTSEKLQQRAQAVGRETITEVSSGMKVIDITGYANAAKNKIEYIAITIKPRAGSYDIDLNETVIHIQYDNLTVLTLDYANSVAGSVSADGVFHTLNLTRLNSTNFGIVTMHDADSSITSAYGMGTSDTAMIIINVTASFPTTSGLDSGEKFIGRIVPDVGTSSSFQVQAPTVFEHRIVEL